ncbi:MAG: rhodanese-like domain-containing protein, partial [Acidiferrobacteraceae bacterium]|nr:rhodanese-like domain-containing protein [Acidiferrobacteraceae bacterium]
MDLDFIANNWHLFAALIVISLLIGIDTMRRGGAGANQVSAVQLPQLINQENAVVVDVCQPEEFRKGHIPAAINIPVEQIKEQLGQLEKFRKKDRPIVLSCRSGQRASRAAAVLRKNEF